MQRRTATALGLGLAMPTAFAAGVYGLMRLQSMRLRQAFDDDVAAAAVPQQSRLVDLSAPHSRALEDVDGDTEHLPALAVIGDSWLAGIAVGRRRRTPAMLIARGLAALTGRPVRLRSTAQAGARADDILTQVNSILADPLLRRSRISAQPPRYAVIAMGSADVIHPITGSIGLPVLTTALNRLQREGGYTVIVLTCPNLGSLPGIPQPLRTQLRRSSRVLAGSQWMLAVSAGAIPMSLNTVLSGTTKQSLIRSDGRFPTPLGYAQLATAVIQRITVDLDLPHDVEENPETRPHWPAELTDGDPRPEDEETEPQQPAAPTAVPSAANPNTEEARP